MTVADQDALRRWWRGFVTSGELPGCFERVQGRLIRSVHRAPLGDGEVFVKTMTFPRGKDRLRYLLRPLPAAHEAAMLRAASAAGVPCPEVVAAFTGRRLGVPHRSMLVLRALPVVEDAVEPAHRAADEVRLAARLLQAGILHHDLHTENFVRTRGGGLFVLDLQSATRCAPGAATSSARLALAARMLREREGAVASRAVEAMRECGILTTQAEVAAALARRDLEAARYRRSRERRCLQDSTEFERRVLLSGVRYAQRRDVAEGRWIRGGRELGEAWLGQRVRQLEARAPLQFGAFFRKWWWLGGGRALYVPLTWSDEQIDAELEAAAAFCRARSAPRTGGR